MGLLRDGRGAKDRKQPVKETVFENWDALCFSLLI